MSFWQRTWRERSDEIHRAFGDTWPPETVAAFSWKDRIRCPGACALALPPIDASRDPRRYRREDWLYMTMGLSQPVSAEQFEQERLAGKKYSSYGIEFAFVAPTEAPWAENALYYFMTYQLENEAIACGHRFPFIFYRRPDGELGVCTGDWQSKSVQPAGAIRALLFWPYLFPESELATSTGKFFLLVATGITQGEWKLAKQKSSGHLQLLLCRAEVGQRTLPDRPCLLETPHGRDEWNRIADLSNQECKRELEAYVRP